MKLTPFWCLILLLAIGCATHPPAPKPPALTKEDRFIQAAARNQIEILESDFVNGVDVNAQTPTGTSALMVASFKGHESAVNWLLAHANCKIDQVDHDGLTALHYAVLSKKIEVVRVLLDHHAHPNAVDSKGLSPLILAARNSPPETAKALLEAGADPNLPDADQWTALFHAISRKRLDVIKVLLKGGARRDLKDSSGKSAAQLAKELDIRLPVK